MKMCPKCPEGANWHQDSAFSRNRRTKDGLNLYCKACTSEYMKEWRARHQENVRQYARQATIQRRFDKGLPGHQPINRTGYRGVSVYKHESKRDWPGETLTTYQARIKVDGKRISLGYHTTPEAAARAYDDYVDEHGLRREKNFS